MLSAYPEPLSVMAVPVGAEFGVGVNVALVGVNGAETMNAVGLSETSTQVFPVAGVVIVTPAGTMPARVDVNVLPDGHAVVPLEE